MIAEQLTPKSMEAETINLLWRALADGATLKEIHGVSDSIMEGIYAHAYKFYQSCRLDDAEVFFRFLCLYDANNSDYAMGLAATLQQKKQYQGAIDAYELAFALKENDYRPKLHIGQCYLFMKNKQQAYESFLSILESDAPALIKTQAEAYLGTIKINEPSTTANEDGSHD